MDISNKTLDYIRRRFIYVKFRCLVQDIENCEYPELDCIQKLIDVFVVTDGGSILREYDLQIESNPKIVETECAVRAGVSAIDKDFEAISSGKKKISYKADVLDCTIRSISKESYKDPDSETGYSDELVVGVVEKEQK